MAQQSRFTKQGFRSHSCVRYVGKDGQGIARVYGEHENGEIAETLCREEALAYVRRRRDTGPLSAWIIERAA
jgi:hypothetical protein